MACNVERANLVHANELHNCANRFGMRMRRNIGNHEAWAERPLGSVRHDMDALLLPILIALVFCGCGTNAHVLELLLSRSVDIVASMLIPLQFASVAVGALVELVFVTRTLPQLNNWPLMIHYARLGTVVAASAYFHTLAFEHGVSVPVHAVLRSASPLATLVCGALAFHRRYSCRQLGAVALVTLGVVLVSRAHVGQGDDSASALAGPALVLTSVALGALLGQLQEHEHRTHGRRVPEEIVCTYAIALVVYAVLAVVVPRRPAESCPFPEHPPPSLGTLALFFATQYACSRTVYAILVRSDAVTATLVTVARKCASLALSVVYFDHAWSATHWFGAASIFTGSLVYCTGGIKHNHHE